MESVFLGSIDEITACEWDSLWQSSYPFTRHAFLRALERSGSVAGDSGWKPSHLVLRDQNKLVGIMPLYIKEHSYGEYVFDWSWADAYQRYGLRYYPKLLNAIPFTPATGPRWAVRQPSDAEKLFSAVKKRVVEQNFSSFHSLFPDCALSSDALPASIRKGCQFHWLNNGYISFDDFLSACSSRKRKSIKKERLKIQSQEIHIVTKKGLDITSLDCSKFYSLYQNTYQKRSGHSGYLTEQFFSQIENFCEQTMLVMAYHENNLIAGSLYFFDDNTLYGRYWGCHEDFDSLHFECCYYQGIDFAIANNLSRFDAGAQGEHKIARGFTPVLTDSYHWLAEPQFQQAIEEFTQEESPHIYRYCDQARKNLPFKEGITLPDHELIGVIEKPLPTQEEIS